MIIDATEFGTTSTSCPKFLPDIFYRHFNADFFGGDRHIAYRQSNEPCHNIGPYVFLGGEQQDYSQFGANGR